MDKDKTGRPTMKRPMHCPAFNAKKAMGMLEPSAALSSGSRSAHSLNFRL
jgi:hypothetical protein